MLHTRFWIVCFALMLVTNGCVDMVGVIPTIESLATLTPSPVFTSTPAISELSTPTPTTPTITPTVTLTLPYTSTPPLHATTTLSPEEMTQRILNPIDGPKPKIHYVRAIPPEAGPGEVVALYWSSEGGTSASITRINPDGTRGRAWQIDKEDTDGGSYPITLRGGERNEEYMLSVTNGIATVEKTVIVTVICLVNWFFQPPPDEYCPAAEPVSIQGSAQEFEHGRMFWMGDTNQIIVLFNDIPQNPDSTRPAWLIVPNPFADGMPEDDPTYSPPPGLKQPRRGFGMVWRTTAGLADRIGWAVKDETPFNLVYQKTPGDTPSLYFNDDIGRVIVLEPEGKSWQVIGSITGP